MPLMPLKASNSTVCLKKSLSAFRGTEGAPKGSLVGWVGCLEPSSCGAPWEERLLKMLTVVYLQTRSRKRAQPHSQCASGTLSAACIRWALQRVQQGPAPVPAPGRGKTVAGNPGCPQGCQRLSALPRRSAACRCVPARKGSLSAPLSAERSSLHPPVSFPTPKPKPWNHRIVWDGNASKIIESNCSPSSAKASPQMPHPHGP